MTKLIARGVFVLAACSLMAACGGGGGSSGSPSGGSPPPTPAATVSGVASKGLLRNAIVTLYGVTAGRIDTTALATTRTDASGRFSVSLTYTGSLVAVLTADASTTMLDEISGADVAVPASLTLHAVMSSLPTQPVAITPLTEVAWDLAVAAGGLTAQNIDNANSAVGSALLGGAPVLTTAPIALNQYATASAAQQAQAKLLTALAVAANRGTATGTNGQACATGSYGGNLVCMIDGLTGVLAASGASATLTTRAGYVADAYALLDQGQVTVNGGSSTSSLGLASATAAQTSLTLCVQLYTCSAGGGSGLTAITTSLSWDGAQATWDTALWQ